MTHARQRFGRLGLACAHLFGGRSRHGVRVRGMLGCRPGRPLFIVLGTLSSLIAVALVLAGLLAARLVQGPIPLDMFKAPMTAALEQRIGNGYKFDIGNVLIEKGDEGFGLIIQSLAVKDARGHLLLAAPKALVGLDLLALMVGDVKPTRLELADLEVRVSVTEKGTIALAAGTDKGESITLPMPAGPAAPVVKSAPLARATAPLRGLAAAIAATVDLATVEKSALGTLVKVGIAHGRLVIDDRTAGRTIVFSGFDLAFDKEGPGRAQMSVAANGPNGRWSAKVVAAETNDRGRVLDLNFKDLSLAEFMLAGGLRRLPFATELPVSGNASFDIDAGGTLRGATGDFSLGAGVLRIDDPDQKPFHIDEVTGRFRLDPSKGRIALDKVQYYAQDTHLALSGSVAVPDDSSGAWAFALQGDGTFAAARAKGTPLEAHVDLTARWDAATSRLQADRLAFKGPAVDLAAKADFDVGKGGPHLLIRVDTDRSMPVDTLGAFWPTYVQARLRQWIIDHIADGRVGKTTLTFDCNASCFTDYQQKRPMPVDALDIDAAVSDLSLVGLDSVPHISSVTGTAKVRSRSATFAGPTAEVAGSGDRVLKLADWTFEIPDTVPKAMAATASARFQAGIALLRQHLGSGPLSKIVRLPPDFDEVHGQIDARVGLDFTIGGGDSAPAPVFRGTGKVSNFGVDKFLGDEKIENCTLNVSLDETGMRAKGDGKIFGAPATLELKKPTEGQGEAIIQATFDDALRAKRGLSLGSKLTGPIIVRATAPLGRDRPKAQVEADFSRAAVNNLLPGWTKAAGKPARATFTVSRRLDHVMLDQFSLDGGGIAMRGNAEFSAAGALISAKLSQLRIGSGDDMRVEASRTDDGLRVAIRAGTFDARPLLRNLLASAGSGAPKSGLGDAFEAGKSLDLDLKAQTVTGQNQRVMKNVELKLTRKGSMIRQLRFNARVGRGQLTARLDPGVTSLLTIAAADAGAALSFFDFYKHMESGRLEASIRMGSDDTQEGSASIDQFLLRDEPAISRVSAQAEQQGGQASSINLNPALVRFTRFKTVFSRGSGKVTLRDTVMWGNEIGATVEGSVDFARDYVNLHGTFVPAYALNNMFAQIPFIGPLLGGGANEGLFAINYRVSGAASAPTVSINLLTAIAPGFLRQIFGAMDGSTSSYRPPDASAYAPPPSQLGFPGQN